MEDVEFYKDQKECDTVKKCVEELNSWWFSTKWASHVDNKRIFVARHELKDNDYEYTMKRPPIHCYFGLVSNRIPGKKAGDVQLQKHLIEVIDTILREHNVYKIALGVNKFSYVIDKWVRISNV